MTTRPNFETTISDVKICIYPGNLVELHYPEEFELDIEAAKEIDRTVRCAVHEEEFSLLINFQNAYGNMSSDVQRYFAKEAPSIPQIRKSAIVLNNLPVRILVKFYLRAFKPLYTTQVFSDYTAARAWLSSGVPTPAGTELEMSSQIA